MSVCGQRFFPSEVLIHVQIDFYRHASLFLLFCFSRVREILVTSDRAAAELAHSARSTRAQILENRQDHCHKGRTRATAETS